MGYAGGWSGVEGMLRRTIYYNGMYTAYQLAELIGAALIAIGFVAFLVNILTTLGWRNILGLIVPEKWLARRATAP